MINHIKKKYKSIIEYFKDEKRPMNEKNFYLVMISSMAIFLMLFVLFIFTGKDRSVVYNIIYMEILSICITLIANITHEETRFGTFFCVLLNFAICPLLFYSLGDIYNGIMIFYVLGIIVTVFLHASKKFFVPFLCCIFGVDISTIIFSHFNKENLLDIRLKVNAAHSITICFSIVSLCVTFLCMYQSYIFRTTKEKLSEANNDIAVAQSSRSRFLANMTHEIRTPMNAIIGMTNLILKEDISDDTKDQINTIKDASTQLLRTINDILEFSKIDSGKIELFNTEYSFRVLFADIIESVSKEYTEDNINFHVFVSRSIPDSLFGDDIKIRQIFRYILFSSLSQTEYGTVYLDIDGDINEEENIVELKCRIASTGEGFSDIELNSMFNAYSNYDSRQKSGLKCMGLELNICKSMLQMMNGDLQVESIEGIGTSVTFNFTNYIVDKKPIAGGINKDIKPLVYLSNNKFEGSWQTLMEDFNISAVYARNTAALKKALEEIKFTQIYIHCFDYEQQKDLIHDYGCDDITYIICDYKFSYGDFGNIKILRAPIYSINLLESLDGSWNEENYKNRISNDFITYPDAKILVVDDSVINLKVEESLLSNYNITPTLASSGREALDILKRDVFDLVLLDQKMPEFDGIDTIHAIRDIEFAQNNVPVICVTAEFGADTKERLQAEGFNDYLAKPINLKYFERILKEYLPEELIVIVTDESATGSESVDSKANIQVEASTPTDEIDILSFDPSIGINNLGGSEEAYLSVLVSYYKEGLEKIETVPGQLAEGNISLYTTNVHALKSSSATVGAMGISPKFKALEFAGKDNDLEYINNNSEAAFEALVKVLDIVKEYLIEKGAFEEEAEEEFVDDGNAEELNIDLINELSSCIMAMNLRRCEEILNELSAVNYGADINKKIKAMKDSYDDFEYMEIKSIINEIIS